MARTAVLSTMGALALVAAAATFTVPTPAHARQIGGNPAAPAQARRRIDAVRATEPIRLDGALDDAVWRIAPVATGFVQAEPSGGQPATETTEVRIAYDDDNLYIGAFMHDRQPDGILVSDIRKDFGPDDQDVFEVILDTYADRRNGYIFRTNPEGARGDLQSANEGRELNQSWDAVWFVRTRRTAEGWTAEMAIPFRSLRFDDHAANASALTTSSDGDGLPQVTGMMWGVNFSRRLRRNNEIDYWSPVPRAYTLSRLSLAGDLGGLPSTSGGRDLRIKPYVAGRTLREPGGTSFDQTGSLGADMKLGVTGSLTLDLTAHPDFAQAEADEQQVNLTQFSQFFPEKRDFFLENSGIFYVGDAARNNRQNPTPTPDEDLLLFHSRRVGLTPDGREIPIIGGARLTGRVAGTLLGALTLQTDGSETTPANNYAVLRARRNLFAGSDAGAIVMMRQSTEDGGDYNRVYGVDANIRVRNIDWNSYAIGTSTPGIDSGQWAVRTTINREGNFFHGKAGFMAVGEGFNDELGYYRRKGVNKWLIDTGLRPRPLSLRALGLREMHPHIVWDYYTDRDGVMIAKKLHSGYTFFMSSGAYAELSFNPAFQKIEAPLTLHAGSPQLPAGDYGWNEFQVRGSTDPSRLLSLSYTGILGGLWSGTQRTVNLALTVKPSYRVRGTLGVQRTDAELDDPVGDFIRTIWTFRGNYSFTTNMFVDALMQYDPDQDRLNANVRFNLIHRPLSDLYIVYNEQRITGPEAPVAGRAIIVKVTRMFSF